MNNYLSEILSEVVSGHKTAMYQGLAAGISLDAVLSMCDASARSSYEKRSKLFKAEWPVLHKNGMDALEDVIKVNLLGESFTFLLP